MVVGTEPNKHLLISLASWPKSLLKMVKSKLNIFKTDFEKKNIFFFELVVNNIEDTKNNQI